MKFIAICPFSPHCFPYTLHQLIVKVKEERERKRENEREKEKTRERKRESLFNKRWVNVARLCLVRRLT